MLIDSHCHLDFYEDPAPILARAHAAGVAAILAIGIGDGPATMHRALDLAIANAGSPDLDTPALYASAGIHPQEAASANPEALEKLATLAHHPRCLAVGEIGLDYYHAENPDIPTQQDALVAQLAIAATVAKPILLHCRTSVLATAQAREKFGAADAWEDLLALLALHWPLTGLAGAPGPGARGGIMHCFSGTPDQARRALAAGFHLSFAGNLTYPKSNGIREAAALAPPDRILVETDAPFLAPIPHRGERNEPALIIHTAAALAALRNLTPAALAALTTRNFHHLFQLPTNN